ncbi:MAG: hypothetical protein AAFV62_03970 [Pseudomonadota bacterium]
MSDNALRSALRPAGRRQDALPAKGEAGPSFADILTYERPKRRLRRGPVAVLVIGAAFAGALSWRAFEPEPGPAVVNGGQYAVALPTYTRSLVPNLSTGRLPSTAPLLPSALERIVQ